MHNYRVEVEINNYIYSVHMHHYEKSMLYLAMGCLVWNSIIVIAVLMTIFDNVSLSNNSQTHIQPLWMAPLVAAALSSSFLTALAIKHRQLAGPMLVGTILATTLYFAMTAILYGLQIHYQWALALSYVGVEMLLALIFLEKKKSALVVALLGLTPTLVSVKADNHWVDISWTIVIIVPIIVAAGLVVIGLTYTFVSVNQYCSGCSPIEVYGHLFRGANSIGLGLFVLSIAMRVIVITNIMILAIPTAAYGGLLILLLICPFKD